MIKAIYKKAANDLGYEKRYIDKKAKVPAGWYRLQLDATNSKPGRPKKKVS